MSNVCNPNDVKRGFFRGVFPLVAVLALSLAPWALMLAIHNAADGELEGDLYLAFLIGALSFSATGPLAVLALSAVSRMRQITLFQYVVFYVITSLPTVTFQVGVFSVSIFTLFIPGGPWTARNIGRGMTAASFEAAAWYAAYFLILYPISRRATGWATAMPIVVAVFSFAIIAVRALHA
jgi:hypothetical protein